MNRFFVDELKEKCNEINSDKDNQEMILKVIEAYDCICSFANMGRKDGLLALEEASEELDLKDDTKNLFFEQISLVVDGTEPEMVKSMGANRCAVYNFPSYLGLINLMYVQGSLMIQAGDNLYVIEKMLKSMMPKSILEKLQKHECENALPDASKEIKNKIEDLCKDDVELEDKDHSVIGETARVWLLLSDKDAQRLLREINFGDLTVAMKGLPGKARAKIFNNMSLSNAGLLVEHISYLGPVRLKDVEEDCVKIMKILLKLCDRGEIADYDFSTLRIAIDMFDLADTEN